MGLYFYVLDTETSGLSIDFHEINQISVLRVSDQEQVSLQIKVKRPNVYDINALAIQGISPGDLKIGVPLEEAVESIDMFLAEDGKTKAHRCIVAHNAPFDRKFVHRAWDSINKEFQADLWMCTQSFAKRYVKKHGTADKVALAQQKAGVQDMKMDKFGKLKPKFGLNNFMLGVGLAPKAGAHQAATDVQNTLDFYNWLMSSNTEHVSLIERVPHKEIATQQLDADDY